MSTPWYVIRTRPLCEYSASEALARGGFEVFFPRVNSPRPRRGQGDEPLFPGYLFLRFDLSSLGWDAPGRLPGVLGWVRFDGVVPPVPDELVADLRERVALINGGGGLWTRFQPGQKVHVVVGATESLAEVLEEARSPDSRVSVLLQFMGRLVQAKVPWTSLRPYAGEQGHAGGSRAPRRTRGRGRWVRGFGPRAVAPA